MKSESGSPFAWLGILGFLGALSGALATILGYERLSLLGLLGLLGLLAVRRDERFYRNLALAGRNAFLVALVGSIVADTLILLQYPTDAVYTVVIFLFPVEIAVFVAFLLGYERWGQ